MTCSTRSARSPTASRSTTSNGRVPSTGDRDFADAQLSATRARGAAPVRGGSAAEGRRRAPRCRLLDRQGEHHPDPGEVRRGRTTGPDEGRPAAPRDGGRHRRRDGSRRVPTDPLSIREAWCHDPLPGSVGAEFERFTGKRMERISGDRRRARVRRARHAGADRRRSAPTAWSEPHGSRILLAGARLHPAGGDARWPASSDAESASPPGPSRSLYVLALGVWPIVIDPAAPSRRISRGSSSSSTSASSRRCSPSRCALQFVVGGRRCRSSTGIVRLVQGGLLARLLGRRRPSTCRSR